MEHVVQKPALGEDDSSHMDEEFSKEEIRHAISSAKVGSAPGPSGQTIALCKYIFLKFPRSSPTLSMSLHLCLD
jgi:hypothetical protein